ncbi:hypothetical protein ACFSR7_06135 [Cohnella sp. GCM10020058]|uniref:hypothetical protein n=1 Tax=Cohnella sp. GCM10020058 TaxID=3317330 RepID=UPI0036284B69
MRKTLMILLMSFVLLLVEMLNANRHINLSLVNAMTTGLFRAAHDASLQVDPSQQNDGFIVFDREKAHAVFVDTFARNLRLKANLEPQNGSWLKDPVEILHEEYIDDSSGVSFPYNYRNDQFKIYRTLNGPAAIFEVRIKSPRSSAYSYNGYIYKNIIQEYPLLN